MEEVEGERTRDRRRMVVKTVEITNKKRRWQKYLVHGVATRGGLAWQSCIREFCGQGGKDKRERIKREGGRGDEQRREVAKILGAWHCHAWRSRMAVSHGSLAWQGWTDEDGGKGGRDDEQRREVAKIPRA
jgi:hypothetical protein